MDNEAEFFDHQPEVAQQKQKSGQFLKILKGIGTGSLYLGGGVFMLIFSVLRFVYVAAAGLGTVYAAIILFSQGSIVWGLVVLILGTSISIAIAQLLFIPVFILSIITLLIWVGAHLFGFQIGIESVWHNLLRLLGIALFFGGGLYVLYSIFNWAKKRVSKRKLNNMYSLFYQKAFPGGQKQIQDEVETLASLFSAYYSNELIKKELIRCTFLFAWKAGIDNLSLDDLISIILRGKKLSEDDAKVLAMFILNKKYK